MNSPVLKDKKWWALEIASIFSAVTAVILAVGDNSFWVPFVILTVVLTMFGMRRAAKLTR
ncbi:hypothetical protein [Lentibacillus sediminis]|uniref:hypothetical protein n=1 Tax=Lentibacillus sediminis TaxID=1940529 RepID=UPI000C1C7EEF|nr:hypothetical protein [Lentibacillus sediminis]